MADELEGYAVAILIAPQGTEQVEFEQPLMAVENAGGRIEVLGAEPDEAQAVKNDLESGDMFQVDKTFADASAEDYDGLIIPGGTVGADALRANPDAIALIRDFFEQGTPVAAICHGPWTLVEADVVQGRTLTAFFTLRTDIRNAGGIWEDKEVVVDKGLVTSRKPGDLDAFCERFVEVFAAGRQQ